MVATGLTGRFFAAVNHSRDKPYSDLKAGQKALDRDYYKDVTQEAPNGQRVLSNFGRFNSIYQNNLSETVKPKDYDPNNRQGNLMIGYEYSHKPDLFQHTRAGKKAAASSSSTTLGAAGAQTINTEEKDKKMVSHWKSMSATVNDENLSKQPTKSEKPTWCLPREAYTSKRSYF